MTQLPAFRASPAWFEDENALDLLTVDGQLVKVSLSQENMTRLQGWCRKRNEKGPYKPEKKCIEEAVAAMANAHLRDAGVAFEITDAEVEEFLGQY